MSVRARILYEDRRSGAGGEYGPHAFVRACVADRCGFDPYDPRLRAEMVAVPLKGIGNIRLALRDAAAYQRDGARLLVLIDGDQAWRHLGLVKAATDWDLARVLLGDPALANVSVHVLRPNLEELLAAVLRADGRALERKPNPTARDRILLSAAAPEKATGRVQILADVPAVARLVDELVGILRLPA